MSMGTQALPPPRKDDVPAALRRSGDGTVAERGRGNILIQ